MTYKISMSNRQDIMTDDAGVKKVIENISSNFIVLGNEVINPSFIISITEVWMDNSVSLPNEPKERIEGHIDEEKRAFIVDGIKKIENNFKIK